MPPRGDCWSPRQGRSGSSRSQRPLDVLDPGLVRISTGSRTRAAGRRAGRVRLKHERIEYREGCDQVMSRVGDGRQSESRTEAISVADRRGVNAPAARRSMILR
ncbi:MAG: hypothetical protein JWP07_3989 [Pseudonocardiales bacterium]|nr:hypothetical protein [Pseudonocardiales bacterium]